ncbi:MAG: transposase [Acidobacteria bacterium]|nr:transposase [Acidobacteriota bacterium]
MVDATVDAVAARTVDAPERLLPLAEAALLTGTTKQNLHKRLAKTGLFREQLCESGPHKGRMMKVIQADDLFRLYPEARARFEARTKALVTIQEAKASPAAPAPVPAPASDAESMASLKDWQRRRMDARITILRHLDHLQRDLGLPRDRVIARLVSDADAGRLPQDLQPLITLANARSGQQGNRTLSRRTLQRWAKEARQGLQCLAPKAVAFQEPRWARALLDLYRQPQKPSLRCCVGLLPGVLPVSVTPPSYSAAMRWMTKVGEIEKNRGRVLERELKAQLPFKRRTFADLLPLDVVSADGHTFDAEVRHPNHGRPFRPEITTVVDIATRKVIGWSVGLAESAIVVADAYRHGVLTHGVPALFYADNGSGYDNALVRALLERIGTTMSNSLPYNSQARGVIERLQRTLWVEMSAKRLPTYIGRDMDRQAKQIVYKHTRKVEDSSALIPWEAFLAFVDAVVAAYNARPHSSLGKLKDEGTRRVRYLAPLESWQIFTDQGWTPEATVERLDELMPQEVRSVQRGEVNLFGNVYFSRALTEWNGCKVRLAYDVHDGARIWVRTLEGIFICEAGFQANATRYFPESVVERARTARLQGQLKRLEDKAGRLLPKEGGPQAELNGQTPIDIEEVTAETMEVSAQQLRKLGLEDPVEVPGGEADTQESPNPRRRPFFKDGKEYALWILDHPEEADPEELAEVQVRLRKDPLYQTWLGRDSAASA